MKGRTEIKGYDLLKARRSLRNNEVKVFFDPIYALPYRIGGRYETIGAGRTLKEALEDVKRSIKLSK